MDHPNTRSLHTTPIPRTGGLAVLAAVLSVGILFFSKTSIALLFACATLGVVSFCDDWRSVPIRWRLAAHVVVASAFGWATVSSSQPILVLALIVMIIVWATNLFNFMDGADGLAAGMAVFGFGSYAAVAWVAGGFEVAVLCLSIGSAALGFLVFNFHPAQIFLGDVGSIPLGFLAAAVGLLGWRDELWPGWFPFLVFSPFFVDASLTLLKRMAKREPFWQAHREHYYQRLVQLGWGHRKTAVAEYVLMLAVGAAAIWAARQPVPHQLLVLAIAGGIYAILAVVIDHAWLRQCKQARAKDGR
jgi:UDP-GlcNAc:undecaprenyl-phosphate/decaprenyl-phosphate GlcNAc-1-phosphate transferase